MGCGRIDFDPAGVCEYAGYDGYPLLDVQGLFPGASATGDLDGDGTPEIVTANQDDGSLSLIGFSVADGLMVRAKLPTANSPTAVEIADLDSDGDNDLVVGHVGADVIGVFLGDGLGGFRPMQPVPAAPRPIGVQLADVDRDQDLDVVTRHASSDLVGVLRSNGDGTFEALVQYATQAPSALALSDLDGDGFPELITSSDGYQTVTMMRNRGDGTFDPGVVSTHDYRPESIVSAELTGDGRSDLAILETDGRTLRTLSGLAIGQTSPEVRYPLPGIYASLSAGDFDGDGDIDLVVGGENRVDLLRNDGQGALALERLPTSGGLPTAIEIVDLDGDGLRDLTFAHPFRHRVHVVLNRGPAELARPLDLEVGTVPFGVAIGDLDRDRRSDLVTSTVDGGVVVLRSAGRRAFEEPRSYPLGPLRGAPQLVDVDHDGALEVIVVGDVLHVLRNDGTGTLGPFETYATELEPGPLAAGDLDGDRRVDLVVVNLVPSSVSVFRNAGDGSFLPRVTIPSGASARDVALGDVDGDGDLDVVVSHAGAYGVHRNDGAGAFEPEILTVQNGESMALVDLDGDAVLDLVVADDRLDKIRVSRGFGNATYSAAVEYSTGFAPNDITLADLDRDGDLDIVTANDSSNSVSLFTNDGDATFVRHVEVVMGAVPTAVGVADLDGDGALDVVTSNQRDGTLAVRFATCAP